jgi:hypothetical protein
MAFWEDLSPAVKRYAIVAAVLISGLLAFRSCTAPVAPKAGATSTRGR